MVGLSPIPGSSISFGEYLIKNKLIDDHVVAIDKTTITFGVYNDTLNPKFTSLNFD
jgi:hypothetical protein